VFKNAIGYSIRQILGVRMPVHSTTGSGGHGADFTELSFL
jgi:hypothetical protein